MSAVAGPSSAKKSSSSKKTKAAAAAAPPARSESVVDSSSEDESENESVNSDDLDRVVVPSTPAASASTPRASKSRSGMARYQPPSGMEPIIASVSFKNSPFEFDEMASKPGAEVWAIRMPVDFKASRLSGLAVKVSSSGVSGEVSTKSGSYALQAASADADGAGAEMGGLSLLVPHMARAGKLVRAPITVSRNLLLTPVEGVAAAAESASTEWVAPPKVKRAQPEHKFKFRNCVAGFDTAGPGATAEAVAAAAAASVAKPQPAAAVESSPESAAKKPKLDKEKRTKKRKSDVDGTPSKKKKKE